MKDKNVKSFGEFNESVFSDQGHAGMNGERYDDRSSDSFTKKDLFEAFSHYAFVSISNQPYNEEELFEEFEEWFKRKYSK
jgi:CRISPR/Cas system type I-B associated protein Csh2 (Cas7 group RAMP superfamily)